MIFKLLCAKSRTVLISALVASAIDTLPALAQWERLEHAPVSEITSPPLGWTEFCARLPGECAGNTTVPRDVVLSRQAWIDLVRVNKWVNKTIKPLTDFEHWGVVERWSYPDDGYGDCEDYVLLKRRILIESGWPREALLVTVVRDREDNTHAVLTVTTDQGDYVLDNRSEDIMLWSNTDYRFVKRQSQADPNVWVALGDWRPAPATAVTPRHETDSSFANLVTSPPTTDRIRARPALPKGRPHFYASPGSNRRSAPTGDSRPRIPTANSR